jgi:hypothetical protein
MEHEEGKREVALEQAIERKAEEIEELVHELKDERKHEAEHEKVKIVVHDEDAGRNIDLHGYARDSVNFFIDQLYEKLGRKRKDDDRLRCECNGNDVFQHSHLNIEHYIHEFCQKHLWLFAGGTGGAGGQAR